MSFRDSEALVGTSKIQWGKNVKPAVKVRWQQRVNQTREYHIEMIKMNPSWRKEDTAVALNRSLGSISEDIMVAQWMKSYPKLERMGYKEAVKWVRVRKAELDRTT